MALSLRDLKTDVLHTRGSAAGRIKRAIVESLRTNPKNTKIPAIAINAGS